MNDILKVIQFATKAHEGQKRKGGGEPYIVHPLRVAVMVSGFECGHSAAIAALLHDTLEDCAVSKADIEHNFGLHVASLVVQLTDPTKGSDEPRRIRKAKYGNHLMEGSYAAKLIKMCDRIDNLRDMAGMTPAFRAMYAEESRNLLSWIGLGLPGSLFVEFSEAIKACEGEDKQTAKGLTT